MAEPKPDQVYTKNLQVLEKIMGVMFNNMNFSDTVFTVKEQKYYALSQLLAASSATMNTLISTHYQHCQDRDIKLYGIRNEESFMIILQYIYGMNINFSQMNITVMCEVLTLSEKYNLDDFFNDLKCFLSKMNCFQLDSVVSLLNTASKYNISELYKRVTVFAYENTEELVKHETFQDLQYNVLVDLIKTDWFCCSEIDILTGVLTWHTDMYDENKNTKKTIQNENIASEDNDDARSVTTNIGEEPETSGSKDEIVNCEDSCLNKEDLSLNAVDSKVIILSTMSDKCKETVQSFCENVLKSLLGHIRVSEISAKVWMTSYNTDWFKKYSDYLQNIDNFSKISKPRQKYEEPVISVETNDDDEQEVRNDESNIVLSNDARELNTSQLKGIKNIQRTFTIHYNQSDTNQSDEEYLIGGLNWKLFMETSSENYFFPYEFYLRCCSDGQNQIDWKCTVVCQLMFTTNQCNISNILFGEKSFELISGGFDTLQSIHVGGRNNMITHIIYSEERPEWRDWRDVMMPDDICTFQLDIKSITYDEL